MSTLSVNTLEPISGSNITISGSLTLSLSQSLSGSIVVSNILSFSPISTPITTEGKIFYSSSGIFYFGNV